MPLPGRQRHADTLLVPVVEGRAGQSPAHRGGLMAKYGTGIRHLLRVAENQMPQPRLIRPGVGREVHTVAHDHESPGIHLRVDHPSRDAGREQHRTGDGLARKHPGPGWAHV